jgi:cytochrome aa3-600 menaquinol oxidase subunit 1
VSHLIAQLFPSSVLRPMELGADASFVLGGALILVIVTCLRKWGWLWREWITTTDHKKIGIMYLVFAMVGLFRGGVDAMLLRTQLAIPNNTFLGPEHYNEIFTTHGTIMVFFMAMPFIFALFNIAIPLMIGARDVAFPKLNAISLWLFVFAFVLFNMSFVVGGSPNAGWTAYAPLTELRFNPSVGENYYLIALQITGIGTIATGVNFLVTILRMRAKGMTLMKMPLFAWSALITSSLIIFAFPALTVALALTMLDRLFGSSFFTIAHGGMPMMYVNLFWIWGHPEVYILVLPAFGIFSEVVATFSGKRLFGYAAMVGSLIAISLLSYGVWLHHFFTMGAGAAVNAFFGVSTMLIAIPTGVKIFNWIFTMWGGRIRMTVAMLWQLAFIPTFVVGGATGVMLAVVPGDYQFHNSYFLIAHFHNVLIGGVVFGLFSGLYYWWPKMFGYMLNERQGKWAYWFFLIGFWVTFFPQYLLGLKGMTRRIYIYPHGLGWSLLNLISTIGAYAMGIGFVILVYSIVYSTVHKERDMTGDPWDGRTLEWSLPSPAPEYNFAVLPDISERDDWWERKRGGDGGKIRAASVQPIAVPNNTPMPFLLGLSFFVAGLGAVFSWWPIAIGGLLAVIVLLVAGWFDEHDHHVISAEEICRHLAALGRLEA